jgi:hypothetical protein
VLRDNMPPLPQGDRRTKQKRTSVRDIAPFIFGFSENASNKNDLLTKYSIVNLAPLLLIRWTAVRLWQ